MVVSIWSKLPDEVVKAGTITLRKYFDRYVDRRCLEGYEPNVANATNLVGAF